MRALKLCLTAALAAALATSFGTISARAADKVIIAQPSHGFLYLPVYVARGKGFFKEENIDLDVQVFAISKWQVPLLYRKAMRGLHLRHPAVKRYRSGRLEITADRHLPIEVDGDYLGVTPVSVHIKPGAIHFKI